MEFRVVFIKRVKIDLQSYLLITVCNVSKIVKIKSLWQGGRKHTSHYQEVYKMNLKYTVRFVNVLSWTGKDCLTIN